MLRRVLNYSQVLILEDPHQPQQSLALVDFCFDSIFTAEMLLRISVVGLREYWTDHWMRFDGATVLISWTIFLTDSFLQSRVGKHISSIRVIRVMKIVKSIKLMHFMREMIT